jgi:predicted amidohydrolase YtcJ
MLRDILAADLHAVVHTVGERAQLVVCGAIERVRADQGFASPYVRLEHAGNYISDDRVIQAWERAGIVPVPNIVMMHSYGDAMPRYLGASNAGVRFPLRTLMARGFALGVGSDVTGDEPRGTNPLFGMWCATQRRAWNGEHVSAQEAVEPTDALRMQTINAARVLGKDSSRGSLESGKLADIVVLDRDPTRVGADELLATRVDLVMVGGAVAHVRDEAEVPAVVVRRDGRSSAVAMSDALRGLGYRDAVAERAGRSANVV